MLPFHKVIKNIQILPIIFLLLINRLQNKSDLVHNEPENNIR